MSGATPKPELAYPDDDRSPQVHGEMGHPLWVDTARMDWSGSPAEGVERKRLELIGDERPQLTTLVRFAPGSRFPVHTHDGGEEFLVLKGTFSDEVGDYAAGTYVRNPPGTRHAPYTETGCTLLVKLRQFQPGDDSVTVVGTVTGVWQRMSSLAERRLLHEWGDERVFLLNMRSGYRPDSAFFAKGVELFVIDGCLEVGRETAGRGSWLRFPPNARLNLIAGPGGCLGYVKQGPFERYAEP